MNAEALGQFLMLVFAPFIPLLAGPVIAIIGVLLVISIFPNFLPSDQPEPQEPDS